MIIIGERINGMFKDIRQAIKEKDAKVIQNGPEQNGAHYLTSTWAPFSGTGGSDEMAGPGDPGSKRSALCLDSTSTMPLKKDLSCVNARP